jgi:hypothetical protein
MEAGVKVEGKRTMKSVVRLGDGAERRTWYAVV